MMAFAAVTMQTLVCGRLLYTFAECQAGTPTVHLQACALLLPCSLVVGPLLCWPFQSPQNLEKASRTTRTVAL